MTEEKEEEEELKEAAEHKDKEKKIEDKGEKKESNKEKEKKNRETTEEKKKERGNETEGNEENKHKKEDTDIDKEKTKHKAENGKEKKMKKKKKFKIPSIAELEEFFKGGMESSLKRPIVTRAEWGGRPPKETAELIFPVKKILFNQTRTEKCYTKEHCMQIVKRLQDQHMDEKGLSDIQYNFLVGHDKNIYEGRGWNARPDKNEKYPELFEKSIEYAYIGTFDDEEPPEKIMRTAWKLLEDGIMYDKLWTHFRVFEDYYQPDSRIEDLIKKYVRKPPPEKEK